MIKKLSQLEFEVTKGAQDPQIQEIKRSCKNEKAMFFEELESVIKNPIADINVLKRKLYANAVTWNSTLNEQIFMIGKRKPAQHHNRSASIKGIADSESVSSSPITPFSYEGTNI
jgi:hypothetical protein